MKICQACAFEFNTEHWSCPRCDHQPVRDGEILIFAPEFNNEEEGFDPEIFADLFDAERGNFWFCVRNEIISWGLGSYFPDARRFLEIGCGTGFVLSHLESEFPHLECSGSELHSRGLAFAAKRVENTTLWQMDARSIPFRGEFDVIGAFDVLEHINEDHDVLFEMNKALRLDGGILLTVPQHPWLWSSADEYAHHERRYSARELHRKVAAAGFRVVRSTSFVTLLLPFMMTSRFLGRFAKSGYDPQSEFSLPLWLNSLFELVMRIELGLIRCRIPLPLGGSRLIIAKKVKDL